MEKALFLSIMFSLPIVFWAVIDNFLKKFVYTKAEIRWYVFDGLWTLSLLMVLFWLLSSTVFLWQKISLVLWFSTIATLFAMTLKEFVSKSIWNTDAYGWFVRDNVIQLFLIFAYVIWVAFFIWWNLSFFSNFTLGSLLSEVIKFTPIMAFIFWTMKYEPILLTQSNSKALWIAYSVLFISLFWLIMAIEKLFRFYVPNSPVIIQVTLWFFLLIFLLDNRMKQSEIGFVKAWWKYKLIYVFLFAISTIIMLNI